jgi:hypothetical protein
MKIAQVVVRRCDSVAAPDRLASAAHADGRRAYPALSVDSSDSFTVTVRPERRTYVSS